MGDNQINISENGGQPNKHTQRMGGQPNKHTKRMGDNQISILREWGTTK